MEKLMDVKDYPTSLEELEKLKAHWSEEREQAAVYLAHLEAAAAKALLTGTGPSHREALASARIAVNEATAVLAEIERQLPQAKAIALQERAKGLRAEAGKLRAEAEKIEKAIAKHLDAIQELEGCRFVPPPQQSRFGDLPARSQQLRWRASKLEDQANHLESSAEEIFRKLEVPQRKVALATWQA